MAIPEKRPDHKYSYADYLAWPDEERWELIEGIPYDMSPAPNRNHQEITGEMYLQLANFLKGKKCKPYISPFDVRLKKDIHAADEETYTVVQPDIVVYCDKSRLDEKGGIGAPAVCVEVLSPSSSYKDENDKYLLYQKYGIKEYWIVNPVLETVVVYMHNGTGYDKPAFYRKEDILTSSVLEGLEFPLSEVFLSEEG